MRGGEGVKRREKALLAGERLLVDSCDAAALMSLSRTTFLQHVAAGHAPQPVRIGRSTRWKMDELRRWVAGDLKNWEDIRRGA